VRHVTRKGKKSNWCKVLVGKREGNRSVDIKRRKWEDNIKIDIKEMYWVGMKLINLAEDVFKGWAFVNTVMKFRVPLSKMKFLTD